MKTIKLATAFTHEVHGAFSRGVHDVEDAIAKDLIDVGKAKAYTKSRKQAGDGKKEGEGK